MRTHYLDRLLVQAHCSADLFPVPAWAECSVTADEGDLAHGSHAGSYRDKVLLGDTDFYETGWELSLEQMHLGGLGQVGAGGNNILVALTCLQQSAAEAF